MVESEPSELGIAYDEQVSNIYRMTRSQNLNTKPERPA